MYDKSNTKNPDAQMHQLPAGLLPGDYNTELFGIRETRKVFAICNGATIPFKDIHPVQKATIFAEMLNDAAAMEDLKHMAPEEALEEYAFCTRGDVDGAADFTPDHSIGRTENFICGTSCRCLRWPSKKIVLNGHALTRREIQITQQLCSDKLDKQIADELNISTNTLTAHKRNIYSKADVQSRPGLVEQAARQRIMQ